MMNRRSLLQRGTMTIATAAFSRPLFARNPKDTLQIELAALEKRSGGRLGVGVLDTRSGKLAGHRVEERFAMCSTCKVLLVAAVLKRADHGKDSMRRTIAVPSKPLIGHSPLTELHAGGSMTLEDLCHAALTQSDNTAANLMLEVIGGPSAYTEFARSIGDGVTRLDRTETALNEAKPGDPQDTTSPKAMAKDLQALLLGNVLQPESRKQLLDWMVENQYGLERLRKDLPAGWRAADKTGSNGETTGNDIGIYFLPGRPPVVVTAYLTECPGTDAKRGAVLAEVGSLVRAFISKG